MDRTEPRIATLIPFPRGGRDALRRQVGLASARLATDGAARPSVDCSAWYHQAAVQEQVAPHRP